MHDHLPSDYQLLGPWKNADEDIIMPLRGTVECCPPVAADEGQQTISGYEYMFCSKVENKCQQRWILH